MTENQRALIREHTRVMVHVLWCRYTALDILLDHNFAVAVAAIAEARERYETARATYLERENRREAQHDEP